MRVTSICQCINILDNYKFKSTINEGKVPVILDKYTGETASLWLKIQTKLSAENVPYKKRKKRLQEGESNGANKGITKKLIK